MRPKLFLCMLLVVLSATCSANDNVRVLLDAYNTCQELRLKLLKSRYELRDNLESFLERYLGHSYIAKNHAYFLRISGNQNFQNFLNNELKSRIKNKKERRKIINTFKVSRDNYSSLNEFKTFLNGIVDILRIPTGSGYELAHYTKEPGGNIAKQKLVAFHAIGNFQRYDRTISEKIYRINIFSPKKNGLFHKNRDVYLKNIIVNYKSNGQSKSINKEFNRFLKRGESVDVELPEIADEATTTLFFACKPEHKKKAYFFIQFVKARLVDNDDSPYTNLINKIKRVHLTGHGIDGSSRELKSLTTLLSNALKNTFENQSITNYKTQTSTNEDHTIDKDSLNYFFYMLKDKDVTREQLINKFKILTHK